MTEQTITELDGVRAVADAVMFEGYMLYPYRATDAKNHTRWQFGVLVPPAFAALELSERSALRVQFLVEGIDPQVSVQARFLQVQQRRVQQRANRGWQDVDALETGSATYLPWDEAVVCERDLSDAHTRITVAGATEHEPLEDGGARLLRHRRPLQATLSLELDELIGPYHVHRGEIRLENVTEWVPPPGVPARQCRPDALRSALVGAHLLLAVRGGAFISLLDPPQWAQPYVDGCTSVGGFPVLAGPAGSREAMLVAPIILYDHPQLAPESAMSFCDSTEMDEMLTLRTMTLTDDEKRQMRGTDPRAAALADQLDDLPPELLDRLHGAIRSLAPVAGPSLVTPLDPSQEQWDPRLDPPAQPGTDVVVIDGVPVSGGTRVRLRPTRRADAQDIFFDGRLATVQAVVFDVDGATHVAVSLDELAGQLPDSHARFLYFAPEEIEPLDGAQ